MWKSKFYGAFVLNHRVVFHAIDATPTRWRGGAGSSPLDRARSAASSVHQTLVDFHTGLYEYIPSLYADAACTFHPEHLLGYAAVAALRLELRYYEAPPPDPAAVPEPVPGFASASGREEAPCDFAAAGYHIRRHSEREGAWL